MAFKDEYTNAYAPPERPYKEDDSWAHGDVNNIIAGINGSVTNIALGTDKVTLTITKNDGSSATITLPSGGVDLTNYYTKEETNSTFVTFTNYATNGKAGVVDVRNAFGVNCDQWGRLSIYMAKEAEIDARKQDCQPIVPKNLDYAVRSVFSDNNTVWSDTDKKAVRAWLGIKEEGV